MDRELIEAMNRHYKRRSAVDNPYATEFLKNPTESNYERAFLSMCESHAYNEISDNEKPSMSFSDIQRNVHSPDPELRARAEEDYATCVFRAAASEITPMVCEQLAEAEVPNAEKAEEWDEFQNDMDTLESGGYYSFSAARRVAERFKDAVKAVPHYDIRCERQPTVYSLYHNIGSETFERLRGHPGMDEIRKAASETACEMVPEGLADSWAKDAQKERRDYAEFRIGLKEYDRLVEECPNVVYDEGKFRIYNNDEVEKAAKIVRCHPEDIRFQYEPFMRNWAKQERIMSEGRER